MLPEGRERVGRDGVHGVGADQLLDVHRVGEARVLDRGARPEATLRRRARLPQGLPAGPAVKLLEPFVGQLGVGDPGLAIEPFQPPGLLRVTGGGDLRGQQLVDLAVDPADEEAGDAVDPGEVAPLGAEVLQAGEEGLGNGRVALDREDQGDVDVDSLAEHLADRREPGSGGGDLDHHIGTLAAAPELARHLDCPLGRARHRRGDLDADKAVVALRLVVDGPEDVGCGLDVLDHQLPKNLFGLSLGCDQPDHGFVVVRRAADRLLEYGRVGGDAADSLVAQPGQLTRADQLAADVVVPEALALRQQLPDRVGGSAHLVSPVAGRTFRIASPASSARSWISRR